MSGCFDRSFTIAGSGSDPGAVQPAETDRPQRAIPTPACGEMRERVPEADSTAYCPATKRATTALVITPWVTLTHASAASSTAG